MWPLTLMLLRPTLAVLLGVLLVNFFIPIKTRLHHALATTLSAGVVSAVWGLVEQREHILLGLIDFMFAVFIADFISTFINFTDRTRNAIVTTIVFMPVHLVVVFGVILLLAPFGGLGPR
jgi:hypothetical protein